MNKECFSCKFILPDYEFYKNKSKKDGLTIYCKKCSKERAEKYWNKGIRKETVEEKRDKIIKKLLFLGPHICWYCGRLVFDKGSLHIDHIIPKSKGGTDELDNFVISCNFCNMAKHNLSVEDFLEWLSFIRSGNFQCFIIKKYPGLCNEKIFDKLQKSWGE